MPSRGEPSAIATQVEPEQVAQGPQSSSIVQPQAVSAWQLNPWAAEPTHRSQRARQRSSFAAYEQTPPSQPGTPQLPGFSQQSSGPSSLLQLKTQEPSMQRSQFPQSPSSGLQTPPSQSPHSPQRSLSSVQRPVSASQTWQPVQQFSPALRVQSAMQLPLKQEKQGPQVSSGAVVQLSHGMPLGAQAPSQQIWLSSHVSVGSDEPSGTF
jgi:hypothetical protein